MAKKQVGVRLSTEDMNRLDSIRDGNGYSRAKLVETIYLKCAVVIEKNSLTYLIDKLDEIQNPVIKRKMI